jgi:hypothetical protein
MVTNQQVRILMKATKTEKTLSLAAAKAGEIKGQTTNYVGFCHNATAPIIGA